VLYDRNESSVFRNMRFSGLRNDELINSDAAASTLIGGVSI